MLGDGSSLYCYGRMNLKIWIYRPDIEAFGRVLNTKYMFNAHGAAYDDIRFKKNLMMAGCLELLAKRRRM